MIVSHFFVDSPDRKIGILLPMGELIHQKLSSSQPGAIIYDPEGHKAIILARTVIYADSQVADCLAKQLYGRPIDVVLKRMEQKWSSDENQLLYLVIQIIE